MGAMCAAKYARTFRDILSTNLLIQSNIQKGTNQFLQTLIFCKFTQAYANVLIKTNFVPYICMFN